MSVSRTQHIVPGALVLLLAVSVAWLSYTGEPADAFLFPRLISFVMLTLALWNFARCLLGLAKVGEGVTPREYIALLPGFSVALVLVFIAAKALGFYVASFCAFFLLISLYDPAPHSAWRSWFKRLLVTCGFMAVIYILFSFLLQVQTPRGLFI
ncbi:MAG: tripartite tricarboxylate transporter TctB family protein [Granulosicoccus sp.]